MRTRTVVAAAIAALAAGASSASAQTGTPAQGNRAGLEQRLRERVASVTRTRLHLTDTQMTQLEAVNARYAPQLAQLGSSEMATRAALRVELASATPDEAKVAALLDSLMKVQKDRIDLMQSEQRDLAVFLDPVQRARYMGLQSQIRSRIEQMRGFNRARGAVRERAQHPPPR